MARPHVRVELNFGTGPYAPPPLVLDEGRLDVNPLEVGGSATWLTLDHPTLGQLDEEQLAADALGEGFWTDLSEFTEAVAVRSGRRRPLDAFSATRLTAVLDNSDRRFDPTNLSGPYVVGTFSAIVPGRPVRVVAEWNGQDWPLAYVSADGWPVTWQHSMSTTTLTGTDAFKTLAGFDPLEVSPVGGGETTGARIHRILDNAGWSAMARDIDDGDSTVQATNLSANALAELKLTADSELGQVFVAPDGRVTFRARSARVSGRSAAAQATFGDTGTTTTTGYPFGEGGYGEGTYGGGTITTVELPYGDLVATYDDETVVNRADVARVGGAVQTTSDPDSIARFTQGVPATYNRTDLILETDSDAAQHGATVVARHANCELRFDSLTLYPEDDDDLWPVALGARFGDRLRILRRPPGGGAPIERECFVEGIDHDIPAVGKWRTVLALSDATTTGGLVLDDPVRGVLDFAGNALTW